MREGDWKKSGFLWNKSPPYLMLIKVNMSVVAQKHYITINLNEIIFAKIVGDTHHLSQINKVVILPQPFHQHVYNIYKFKYIFLILRWINMSLVFYKLKINSIKSNDLVIRTWFGTSNLQCWHVDMSVGERLNKLVQVWWGVGW